MKLNRKEVTSYKLQVISYKAKSKKWLGQSLVEVIVALGIVVILAVSLVTSGLITQKTARAAKNDTQATKLVQEYIEEIRIFRDREGFDALTPAATCYTLSGSNPDSWALSTSLCPDGEVKTLNGVDFKRKFAVSFSAGDTEKLITVTVSWQESGATRVVSNYTYLANTH